MSFDFDTVIDRRNTFAAKWDFSMAAHGQDAPTALFEGEGPAPISMSVADMEFAAPPCVTAAMKARIDHGILGYTAESDAYREAVLCWQLERHHWAIAPDWVLTHRGVLPSLFLTIRRFIPQGSRIVLQTPAFPPFFDAISVNNCEVVTNELTFHGGRYEIDLDSFEDACADPAVRLFILCNPHNPVGRCFTADELTRMAEICLRHDVMIFADEIHGDLIMPGHRLVPFLSVAGEATAKTIQASGLSKTMNLAGLHLSNVIIPDKTLREAYAEGSLHDGNWGLNPVSKAGLMAGFRDGGPWLDALLAYVSGNMALVRDFCAERLPEFQPIAIEGTYLQWIDMRGAGLGEDVLIERILSRARIRLEAGSAFGPGGTGFARMNVACPRAVVQDAMERLERAVRANA
ncbi:MAG: pyridoxal phosphate-dependent aminotransferase [Rhodospirillales bacterium]|nr:pyridoxal phosphate-dependent aminotransferase [Rhodospirillales bacterium]